MPEIPESHRAILAQPGLGVLGTIGPNGMPYLSMVGFLLEDEMVRITVSSSTQKVRNLDRDPSCSFLVADLSDPQRTVEVRGRAVVERDEDYEFVARLARALGNDDLDVRTIDPPGETRMVVTIKPARVRAAG